MIQLIRDVHIAIDVNRHTERGVEEGKGGGCTVASIASGDSTPWNASRVRVVRVVMVMVRVMIGVQDEGGKQRG